MTAAPTTDGDTGTPAPAAGSRASVDLDALAAKYTEQPVPPCPLCGAALKVAIIGGGRPTKNTCPAADPDVLAAVEELRTLRRWNRLHTTTALSQGRVLEEIGYVLSGCRFDETEDVWSTGRPHRPRTRAR